MVSGLSFATSIDFNADGDAYVSINGVGAPGSGAIVMFAGLTDMPGTPLTGATPATLPQTGGEQSDQGRLSLVFLGFGFALLMAGWMLKHKGLVT